MLMVKVSPSAFVRVSRRTEKEWSPVPWWKRRRGGASKRRGGQTMATGASSVPYVQHDEAEAVVGPRGTADALFEEDALVRIANQPTARDYQAQLFALIYWSAYLQLPRLTMPALVLHGLQDALIPPQNGRVLAARLPRARLVELPEASHWLTTDRTDDCLSALRDHLESHRS